MINTVLLFIILIVLLVICFMSNKILINPATCFTASFVFSVGYALVSNSYIQLNLSVKTFSIICAGVCIFVITAICTQKLLTNQLVWIRLDRPEVKAIELNIHWIFLTGFILVQLFVIYEYKSFYTRAMGIGSFTQAMYEYRNTSMFTDEDVIYISNIILYLRRLCVASGYIFSYALFHSLLAGYKNHKILLSINILLSIYLNTLSGSREPAITYVLTMLVQLYLLYGDKNHWKNNFKIKHFLGIGLLGIGMIYGFKEFGNMLGRQSTKTVGDYLAVYVSAPIKNLDGYIRTGKFGASIDQNQTFINIINWIAKRFGISSWSHGLDLPFQYNSYGKGLGNVYTTFYSFLYDGGIIGLIICVVLLAVICEISFLRATNIAKRNNSKLNIYILCYAYIVPNLAMSFFSNKFYENIFNPLFILYLFIWIVLSYIFFDIRLEK